MPDALASIGGVVKIIMFVFLILLRIHTSVKHYLYMLNYVVLKERLLTANTEQTISRRGDYRDGNQINLYDRRYKYWEVFCFISFPFCQKKNSRYWQFEQDCAIFKSSLDVRNFII